MKSWMIILAVLSLSLLNSCKAINDLKDEDDPVPEQSEYSILTESKGGLLINDYNRNPEITFDARERLERLENIVVPSDYELEYSGISQVQPNPVNAKNMQAIYQRLFEDRMDEEIKVQVNFDAAALSDVVPSFATPLKINYILDPDAAGTVTMSVSDTLSIAEVWKLFEQILMLSGAYCELEGKVLHIRPVTKMPQEKQLLSEDSNIEARVMPLKFVAAPAIVTQIARLLPSEGAAIALEKQNALLVVETRANIVRLTSLIEQLDRKPRAGWSQVVIPCVNVSSSQIKEELLNVLPVLGYPAVDAAQENEPGSIAIASLDRVQAIVATSVTPESLVELRRWVKILDRSETSEQERVYLYEVINGNADQLMQIMSVIFPLEGTTLTASGTEGETKTSTQTGTNRSTDEKEKDKVRMPNHADSLFKTPVNMFADAVQNRLVIRTTPRAYAMIDAILKRVDTIPAQILMQVLVVEIELSDNNEFGMEFSIKGGGGNAESIFDTNFEALQPGGPPGQTGGKIYIFNPNNPDEKFGYIRAIAGRSKLRVLSSPQILATSHSEAKISVGKRVPIVTSDITDTASSVDPDNTSLRRSYQYEDTGIILTVTPTATKGGLISMQIKQIISDAVENSMRGIDSPIIKQDELNTTLALRDGRTLIMGGLIKEKHNETISSIPIIADIPFLRNILGNTIQTAERTEILVLITATIINEETELQQNIRRYNQAIDAILRFEKPLYESKSDPKNQETAELIEQGEAL